MISFKLNGDTKLVEYGINLPNALVYADINGFFNKLNLKIYLNGKQLRKKLIINDKGWSFVKPLKLTKDDVLTYTWERRLINEYTS